MSSQTIQCKQCGIEAIVPTICAVCGATLVKTTGSDGKERLHCPKDSPEGEPVAREPQKPSSRDMVAGFGAAVKARRLELGLTSGELAIRAETAQPSISKLENEARAPSLYLARRIANALECTLDELLALADKIAAGKP
jgi:DNA-binding XRE family transcriptional regulator